MMGDVESVFAKEHDLLVMEDAAQAHLARFEGQAATFSFFPGKNLGAYGDAGFVLCATAEIERLAKMHANHGRLDKYLHEFVAGNYRMDGLQATILGVKLRYLDARTEARIKSAALYDELLVPHGFTVIEPAPGEGSRAVYHLYVVEVANRGAMMDHLKEQIEEVVTTFLEVAEP